ncbi:MAG: undecaprenyl-diphosphate phosphatase [Pseudomonadota bacterium]|nr:undecaprenyl-diphosphate phosphatase [Pseudomonadota bacterium]
MPVLLIVLVAAVQGLTEFLPVSSSGHLALILLVTYQPYQGRAIDVAAHVGTLGAVMLYLRADLMAMLMSLRPGGDQGQRRLILLLAIATLPVIIAGFIVNDIDPAWLLDLRTLAIANLVFAALLWHADHVGDLGRRIADMKYGAAVAVGLIQCLALIPGASRSGVTMTAARYLGFDRLSAARFSLLLSIPTIAGAGLLKGLDIIRDGDVALGIDAALVALLSFGFALAAIGWMMRWLARADFRIFVWYRMALGAVLLLAIAVGGV